MYYIKTRSNDGKVIMSPNLSELIVSCVGSEDDFAKIASSSYKDAMCPHCQTEKCVYKLRGWNTDGIYQSFIPCCKSCLDLTIKGFQAVNFKTLKIVNIKTNKWRTIRF
jgi:hypothetical protein